MPQERKTLTGRDYSAAEVFELERERIFCRATGSMPAAPSEAPEPGDFFTVDVAGESVLVLRGRRTASCAPSTTSAATAAPGSATRRRPAT